MIPLLKPIWSTGCLPICRGCNHPNDVPVARFELKLPEDAAYRDPREFFTCLTVNPEGTLAI